MSRLLSLAQIHLSHDRGQQLVAIDPSHPLVVVANHPYGIADGIALLSIVEQLGRPFKVLINDALMKVPEMRRYGLPISFAENREAVQTNMQTRREAVSFLRSGGVVAVFPGGGVATAPGILGRAQELPWKRFPARLIQQTRANVLPVYFYGQNSRLFQASSRVSMTLRTALFIHEFRNLTGCSITAKIGDMLTYDDFSEVNDRDALTKQLYDIVFALEPLVIPPKVRRSYPDRLRP